MATTRPDIYITPKQDNDIYALLNAQAGFPAVTVGAKLRIQNKGSAKIYIHQSDETVTDFAGGTSLPSPWQSFTDDGILGCKVTAIGDISGLVQVEVLA